MKTLIAAAMLLALTVPAHASPFRASDVKWIPLMDRYRDFASKCHLASTDDDPSCFAAEKQANKLRAAGYCLYDRASIGRPSKDRKHCYEIEFSDD